MEFDQYYFLQTFSLLGVMAHGPRERLAPVRSAGRGLVSRLAPTACYEMRSSNASGRKEFFEL